nr:mechanosensitive ion channel [Thiohalocapsa halophila]
MLVVGVAYGSDVEPASAIMTRIAHANEHVLDEPPPVVTFDTFGDNALTLTLRAFVDSVDARVGTISALNRAINQAFADAGISIAFPQRDLHRAGRRPTPDLGRVAPHLPAQGSQRPLPVAGRQRR